MKKLIGFIKKSLFHYYRFGIEGVKFYLKIKYNKDQFLKINLKEVGVPLYLRNKTSDIPAFYDVFTENEYELNLIKKPKTIIDCGANIGLATAYFKGEYPDAKIISVEPEQDNYELLQKNTESLSNVHCLNYGVWNKSALLEVHDVGLGNWGFTTTEVQFENESTIEAISISEIIDRYKIDTIDILKIDVEGSEREIFQENTDEWLSKVKILIVELHDHMRSGCSESFYSAMNKFDYNMTPQGNNLICYMK